MQRLTTKTDDGFTAKDMDSVIAKLAKYEDLQEHLESENKTIASQLSALRESGKEKTVRHRELLGKKLQIVYALSLFQACGL